MIWSLDPATAAAAAAFPLPIKAAVPAAQFAGFNFNTAIWNPRVLHQQWPAPHFQAGPQAIIDAFAAGHDLEALAMVVSWGAMGRTGRYIYGGRDLADIALKIASARDSIQHTNAVNAAWGLFTVLPPGGLGWSPVISSKTLHFLCRSLGIVQDPAVAIDNAVILNRVWPAWRALHYPALNPGDWKGRSLDAYLRYMTAIITWANARGWTTTQLEATIFAEY